MLVMSHFLTTNYFDLQSWLFCVSPSLSICSCLRLMTTYSISVLALDKYYKTIFAVILKQFNYGKILMHYFRQ